MNIKLGYISDCHLEFSKRSFHIPDGLDILIIAGDTHKSPGDSQKVIQELRGQTCLPIVYICGNHEFYGRTFPNAIKKYKQLLEKTSDVHVLQRDMVVIKGVRILGTTLWSDLSDPLHEIQAQLKINDYRFIKNAKYNREKITPKDTTAAFEKNKKWITSMLKQNFDGPTVVVTHHLPSFQVVDPRFRGNSVTPAYASVLDDIILDLKPDVWIFGHSHSGLDVKIGDTDLISNPIGYPEEGGGNPMEFKEFNLVKKIKKNKIKD